MTTVFPDCPTTLDDVTIDAYRERGFIVFENALSPAEVEEARNALSGLVRHYCDNPEDFKVSDKTKGKSSQSGTVFQSKRSRMFFQLEKDVNKEGKRAEELEEHIRKYMWFEHEAPIFERICTNHPRIQGAVKSLLGTEIELYQSMALVKPAHIGIDKPWHQDNAYFSVEDLNGIVGTWIALDDSTIENGCMHFIPGGHLEGPRRHHHTYDCEIVPERLDTSQAVPVELSAGGMILFHGNIPHYTPPNRSDHRRRAIQYHYRRVSNRVIPTEEYYTVFREADGTPASCAAAARGF